MNLKIYNKTTGKWEIVGSSNASNIEVVNPGFVNESGGTVSLNNALTKIDNRLTKAEQNIIWLAHNKGEGGGGGGSTESVSYTINLLDGDILYTSTGAVTINFMISSGNSKKAFTVIAKNYATGATLGTYKKYSMTNTSIDLVGLTETTTVELSAYDSSNNYCTPIRVKVVAGAIKLSLDSTPASSIYMGGTSKVMLNFQLVNNSGSAATFYLTVNDKEYVKVEDITVVSRSLQYDAREILFKSGLFEPKSGLKFTFKAWAETSINGEAMSSSVIKFEISTVDANTLVIITSDISEDPEEPTVFSQGTQLAFGYYLSCGITDYKTFNMEYSLIYEGEELLKGEIKNITKGEDKRMSLSTVSLPVMEEGAYMEIKMFGYAVNNPNDSAALDTRSVYCRIQAAEKKDLYANNDVETLLAYFSRVSGFPNNTTGDWVYKPNSNFKYSGPFDDRYPNGMNLKTFKCNGTTTGFIGDTDYQLTPAVSFNGEAYGYLEVKELFPKIEISAGESIFTNSGFNISTTFKCDETADSTETILSLATYENDKIKTGYEITVENITCKIGSADTLTCILPLAELLTVDLDVSYVTGYYYFKIYINGVLSAVSRVAESRVDWTFAQDLYLACRNNAGTLSRFSTVKFYDIKLYTSSQSEYAITQNYISATCQALLKGGAVNADIDSELRLKNFFTSDGKCLLWNSDPTLNNGKGDYLEGSELYDKLIELMNAEDSLTPYPVVLIEETSSVSTLFYPYSEAVYSAAEKEAIMSATFPCKVTYQDATGECIIETPDGVAATEGVRIGLLGTSSLSYNAKNFELYLGAKDEAGNDLLFTPKDEWLPENEFTLKADVMDSAHVNNVVIGKIVNGAVKNSSGQSYKPFSNTPPMDLDNSYWPSASQASAIRDKIKHTSEGFPVLLFIRFANTTVKLFMGIYNFNLGRKAFNNLGMRLLKSYEKPNDGPCIVDEYELITDPWGKEESKGNYSIEINQNSSALGAFQLDDLSIVKFMGDVAYTSNDDETAYALVLKFYNYTANTALGKVLKYKMNADNTGFVEKDGEFYDLSLGNYYNFEQCDKYLNWRNACSYFMIAIVFGMVDSLCKNLTLRSWGTLVWYLCFYDMDTAFSLDNAGLDEVAYWAHIHRWYNIFSEGLSSFTIEKNYIEETSGVKLYYASWWNRIWEILENMPSKANDGGDRLMLELIYAEFRLNMFPDPKQFIDDYYKAYTDLTGSIVFNYDYRVKYLKQSRNYDTNTGQLTDSTDFSQLKFLHGNRVIHVKDWFYKRIMFLDGVYGYKAGEKVSTIIASSLKSPITSMWSDNKATGNGSTAAIRPTMAAKSKILTRYSLDTITLAFWLDETPYSAAVSRPGGLTVVYVYGNEYITQFTNLSAFTWQTLTYVDLPLLESVDLSNIKNMTSSTFTGGVYDPVEKKGLKNVKELILSGFEITSSAYTLDISNCSRLLKLDLSGSSITNIQFPEANLDNSLKYLNLSNTDITALELSNQSFLSTLVLDGCNKLTSIKLTNMGMIESITIPASVLTIDISLCPLLKQLNIVYSGASNKTSELIYVSIDACEGLEYFNISGQNNKDLIVNLTGAKNLKTLNVSGTNYKSLILPNRFNLDEETGEKTRSFTSLQSINISNTEITGFAYSGEVEGTYIEKGVEGNVWGLDVTIYPMPSEMNLITFYDLNSIDCQSNKAITVIRCANNEDNPIELSSNSFANCNELLRIYGHFSIEGASVFKGCGKLTLNSNYIIDDKDYRYDEFRDSDDFCNISLRQDLRTCANMFEGCTNVTTDDFRYIMDKLPPNVLTIDKMWYGCAGVSYPLDKFIFSKCPRLTNATSAFESTGINGTLTAEILKTIPELQTCDRMFAKSGIKKIDNDIYYEGNNLIKIDEMFAGCVFDNCVIQSDSFFINLNFSDYPLRVFEGCSGITMDLVNKDNTTLLFHFKKKPEDKLILTADFLSGLVLNGEILVNVFGGVTDTVDGYYIPGFASILYPFSHSGATIKLSEMSNIFRRFNSSINQLLGIFLGLKIEEGYEAIPDNLLENCKVLNSVAYMFAESNIKPESFPSPNLFKDCTNLSDIEGLVYGCNTNKFKLNPEGFKNCKLKNVVDAFSNSAVYGGIPYKFFKMSNATIEDMSGCFNKCYNLWYTKDLLLNIGQDLSGYVTRWTDRVVENFDKLGSLEYLYDNSDNYTTEDDYSKDGRNRDEDDIKQATAIKYNADTPYGDGVYLNYAIPADLFRWCAGTCNIKTVLSEMFWAPTRLVTDDKTGNLVITATTSICGPKGRIPKKLLSSLVDASDFSGLFKSTYFAPFISRISLNDRGLIFPDDLLENNVNLLNISSIFEGYEFPACIDINPDLIKKLAVLSNASSMFKNCIFNTTTGDGKNDAALLDWNFFIGNGRLENISGLFEVATVNSKETGLYYIDETLFQSKYNPYINNISYAFYGNSNMKGSVPLFDRNQFTYLKNNYTSYLSGVPKANITNADSLDEDYRPQDWD